MTAEQTAAYYDSHSGARLLALFGISLGTFMTVISLSAAVVAVPAIAGDLGVDATLVGWIPASFMLANLAMQLPAGRIADIHGRKRLYMIGLCTYLVASLLAFYAPGIEFLLATRALQGLGAAFLVGTGFAIVGSIFRHHGRGAAVGWLITSVYLGVTVGPLLGGWITEHIGWRYVFLVQVPIGMVSLLIGLTRMQGEWSGDREARLDWFGSGLFVILTASLFIGATHLPRAYAFAMCAIAVPLFYWFVLRSDSVAYPLVPVRLIRRNRAFTNCLMASMFAFSANLSVVFTLLLYLQYNRGLDPTEAGLMITLQALLQTLMSPFIGRLADRFPPRRLAGMGALLVAVSLFALLFLYRLDSLLGTGACLLLMGLGFALFTTPNHSAVLEALPEAQLGVGSALTNLFRLLGQTSGTAMVTLLITLYIGKTEISSLHFDAIERVLAWVLSISTLATLCAAWFSWRLVDACAE